MRLMTSLGLCTTTIPETYMANSKTAAFVEPIGRDGVRCMYVFQTPFPMICTDIGRYDLTLPAVSNLPNFLSAHNYTNPSDYNTSPMQWTVGKSQFEWLAERPEHQRMFDAYMANRRQGKKEWSEVYPFYERFMLPSQQQKQPDAFIVNIGGNHGHNLQRLVEKRWDVVGSNRTEAKVPGPLVLQDLPAVIAQAPQIEGVEQMPYSFFDPQPIKGLVDPHFSFLTPIYSNTHHVNAEARVYFFRAIFHDWPDHICHQILSNTVAAMDPATSRIIIVDHVLSDIKASLTQTSMDIQMMSIGAGMERSLRHWKQLLAQAGLEIQEIWWGEPGLESVVEATVIRGK